MEMNNVEVQMIIQTSARADSEKSVLELADLQMALVGGGCGEVVLA